MKKMIRILAISLLCLMLALPAGAAANPYRQDVNADRFIDGTNLLRVADKTGYALADVDGNLLTAANYSNFSYVGGYVTAAQADLEGVNVFGAFDTQGNIVIPFEYNVFKFDSGWGIAIALVAATADAYDYKSFSGEEYYNIDHVDFYYMPAGAKVGSLTRDQYLDHQAVNGMLNIQDRTTSAVTTYDTQFNVLGTVEKLWDDDFAPAAYTTFRDNGQTGIQDKDGNVIMQPAYKSIYVATDNYFTASDGTHEGLVDLNGNVVVPVEYDSVKRMSGLPMSVENKNGYDYLALDTYYCAVKDDKMCFIDVNGNVTFGPKYSKDIVTIYGAALMLQDLEGNTIIVAADGTETTVSGYERITHMNGCSGVYYRVSDADYNYGVINWHGEEVLPCEYKAISFSGDGHYALATKDYKAYELYALDYPTAAGTAAAGTAAEAVEIADEGELLNPVPPVERLPEDMTSAPAETTEAAAPASGDNTAVLSLLNSAVTLLQTDAAANGASAVSLLNSAATLTADASAASLITSAATLLGADAAANAAAAITLIQNAIGMMQ